MPSPLLLARMRAVGMRMPLRTYMAAHGCGLNLALACSLLMQETGGGVNEFGHDPTVCVGWGEVTKSKYLAYRALRDQFGHGSRCQGVGPCQLTYVGYQDQADEYPGRLKGCWRPLVNMRVGFQVLAEHVRRDGLTQGVAAYNGSGPEAQRYAAVVIERARLYAGRLRTPAP